MEKEKAFQCIFDVMVFGVEVYMRYREPDPNLEYQANWRHYFPGSNELYELLRSQRNVHLSIHKSKPEVNLLVCLFLFLLFLLFTFFAFPAVDVYPYAEIHAAGSAGHRSLYFNCSICFFGYAYLSASSCCRAVGCAGMHEGTTGRDIVWPIILTGKIFSGQLKNKIKYETLLTHFTLECGLAVCGRRRQW